MKTDADFVKGEHLSSEIYQERHYRELKLVEKTEMYKIKFNKQRSRLRDVEVRAFMGFLGKYFLSIRQVGKMWWKVHANFNVLCCQICYEFPVTSSM